ncbi:hypothetical protein DHEL01_v209179 [Diaporthe helianthi]|uniref:Uncharacterized protein n=1 Tax=Diaporthe helianthi TaxID=158607 RepID=A0A2P5HQ82_DIAHE|nr:hypothetical protein DHEL01_v209179 [Diaporthe helianthi]
MPRLITFIQTLFCIKPKIPDTAAMTPGTQNRGPGPKPVENNGVAAAFSCHGPVQGTSKNDQDLLNDLLGFLDKKIQDETLDPKRRESIRLTRNFVKEHGYPVEEYCIYAWATHGIVKVLTDEQTKSLPKKAEHTSESYLLGAPEIDLRSFG